MAIWKQWTTPIMKQCFAVSSVTLNVMVYGMVIGYNVSLFSELRKTREIVLTRDSESWLASLIGLTILSGTLFTSIIIDNIGRKPALLISSVLTICGWISFTFASSLTVLLTAKILQGTGVGIGSTMSGILIAEYSSPRYRGPFMATVPAGILFGILISHSFGFFYNWHEIATILLIFLPGLILAVFTPESPSFLAIKGRYDECRRVFRWLRGPNEDEELEKLIKTDMILKESEDPNEDAQRKLMNKLIYVATAFKKREFPVAVFIATHLYAINQFCGGLLNDTYTLDIHTALYGTDAYMFKVVTSLDVQKILSTLLTIYITTKVKRRPLLFTLVGFNVLIYICEAGYIYIRHHSFIPDHIAIGITLQHLHVFSNGAGSIPLTTVIASELFPLADRGFCGLVSGATLPIFLFTNLKTAPYLFSLIGIDGAFCFYALILSYCLVVLYYVLPETKDKTLQEVEDELRGYSLIERGRVLKNGEAVCIE